jgi:flavin reductase (DIM6/NTAB) family NADH-FMN oxidoreductase RutF
MQNKRENTENLALEKESVKDSVTLEAKEVNPGNIDSKVMFKLSYGLFMLSARLGDKDNGCITNTVIQITSNPLKVSVTVNKANLTHDMIVDSGKFNISVLTEKASFSIFERFGFASGRDKDKFAGYDEKKRADNGIYYITENTNGIISGDVSEIIDVGTHSIFIADVTEAIVLSNEPSVTYQYYFDNIKPKPQAKKEDKKGYVCKICGYVYEGEELPSDFICPICKHGAADFEKL